MAFLQIFDTCKGVMFLTAADCIIKVLVAIRNSLVLACWRSYLCRVQQTLQAKDWCVWS
ncbi:hypothetical protein GBAR_LOCUS22473, partial [Geodia barretti]